MAYSLVKSGQTEFAVDWDVVERLCRSYWFSYYQDQYSELKTMSESTWYNPFSWSMPDIRTVEVDWDKVQSATRMATTRDMLDYGRGANLDVRAIARDVQVKVERTQYQKKSTRHWLREVQGSNVNAMEKADRDYTGLIEACRFVRDTSADVVAIGSTIATGGASIGLLAGSSTMKGVFKYQDTGKVGASVLYGTGSMALGLFKVGGAKLTTGGEYVLIVAQGFLDGGTSFVSGKSFGDSVATGVLKIAGSGGAQAVFGSAVVKNIFGKMPIPFSVFSETSRNGVEYTAVDVANELLAKTSKKLLEKGIKAGIPAVIDSFSSPRASSSTDGRFIDDAPVDDELLLMLSIVNMKNGIGRGW